LSLGVACGAAVVIVAFWPGVRGEPATADLLAVHARPLKPIRLSDAARSDALRRARVWRPRDARGATTLVPAQDVTAAYADAPLECRFEPSAPRGTTTKFDCVLGDGDVVKVKYGTTPEIQAEVAASRLLAQLGFGADDMAIVPQVRCFGCPRRPFETSQVVDRLPLGDRLMRAFPQERFVDFEWVAVERRLPAPAIETGRTEGWAWFELQQATPPDSALRAERDALALAARLLAHWDNKGSNQRLVCLDPEADRPHDGCRTPFAMIHDLGATFGPNKVNLRRWTSGAVWADARRCTADMRDLPYNGGTFPPAAISEAGRQMLLRELTAITHADARAWLSAARFDDVDAWTGAFFDKVREIREAGPCPQ
jgi:hypothetical protein